jgi:hypothetical protein
MSARTVAESALQSLSTEGGLTTASVVPIWLPFERLAQGKSLETSVLLDVRNRLKHFSPQKVRHAQDSILSALVEGRAFLLLDALDETPSRSDIRTPLRRLHVSTRVLLTSRPMALQPLQLPLGQLVTYELMPLRHADRRTFMVR